MHLTRNTAYLHFWYGAGSRPVMVTYNGKDYGYAYNLQGDVIALTDMENGFAEVVSYAYDSWGRLTACTGAMAETLGRENPFRYRGYVYDEETGLYYLKSRYYNPEWGRFVSSDSMLGNTGVLFSHNVFGYCMNNPVCYCDVDGKYRISAEDLASDWAGRTILLRYMFGGGNPLVVIDDASWNRYMQNAQLCSSCYDYPAGKNLGDAVFEMVAPYGQNIGFGDGYYD